MQLFYHPHIRPSFELPKEESRHLVRVLRRGAGDEVRFTDGLGRFYTCVIDLANEKSCRLRMIKEEIVPARAARLTMAIAPTKNMDRLEWFVEKATEIGVEQIVPVFCEHSERKKLKTDRLQRIALAAMKQSLKAYLPEILEPRKLSDWIAEHECHHRFVAHLDEDNPGKDLRDIDLNGDVTVLIGPEGDFSPDELKLAAEAGYEQVTLGNSRLRTETAGVVACAHLAYLIDKLK